MNYYQRSVAPNIRCNGPLCMNKSLIPSANMAMQSVNSFWNYTDPVRSNPCTALVPKYSQNGNKLTTIDPHFDMIENVKFPTLPANHIKKTTSPIVLSSRYTPFEWSQINFKHYNEADTNRNMAEKLRSDAIRVIRETEEKTHSGQRDTGRRISERLSDIRFWRNELSTELERIISEIHLLQDTRKSLEKSINDCNSPLHLAQECLYQREGRLGIDLVRDQAEEALIQEIGILHRCKEQLNMLHRRVLEQLKENRTSQHELELDLKSKESALDIDLTVHQINNLSVTINNYTGVDKFDQGNTIPQSWADHSNRIVQRSQQERIKSTQLRTECENTMGECANAIWNAWNFTNSALSRRSNEVLEAKNKLQMYLHKIQQEIYDVEKSIEMLKRAINEKSNPLKVAQTRLEIRTHRRDVELCKDGVHERLTKEIDDLQSSINYLTNKLNEAENQHQQLLVTQSELERDLHIKVNSLFIDRDKCLGIRKACPITTIIKF